MNREGATYPPGESKHTRVERCEAQASRIAAHRLRRSEGRIAYGKGEDTRTRERSGLSAAAPEAWGNRTYGAWYDGKMAKAYGAPVDAQSKAFGDVNAGAGKVDYPWEFSKFGSASSDAVGGWQQKVETKKLQGGSSQGMSGVAQHGVGLQAE